TTRPTSPRTSPPARGGRNAARCQEILRDPLLAAEEMWREHLVVSTEDNSNRRTVDLDGVIRSNLANACVPRMDETSCERNICYNVYFRFRKNTCVRVSRSSPICGSGNQKPRQQLNENTGYIDASPIYGSSVHDSEKFRQGKTGFLKLPAFNGMQMLPFDQSKCKSRKSCTVIFTAGDSRVNLFVGLSAWHTIFTKEHNRLVSILRSLNPHWDGERLYHEARKIVGAEVQAIVYREWLPKILGAAFSSVVGDYRGYDPTIDATIANEFTSAAFRFGHGMIQEFYQRLDPNFGNSSFGALPFQKGTLHSDVLVNEGGPDPLLRGMFSQSVKRPQRVTTTVTENMFGSTDLSSINIQVKFNRISS
ncbi:animal hem peroxidase, partial [Necator americanus]